ncbi:helix-turn-helix domain-containing protein [Amycolatopsis sp. NPDC004169]|uniref:helix-turn-helix domain-containing protein n=1 Tax=Amycolatopsis sp. NPDC004169 TaxID=3154453 RepID=UPI0033B2FF80
MRISGPAEVTRLSPLLFDALTEALARDPVSGELTLVARIQAFIAGNLGDPGLTPETIAAAHHISVRYLQKLFQQEGRTVAGWIRRRRLEQCRRDLADPRLAGRSITAIAARWGFASPAHFSHAFRGAYGVSPRQFRRRKAVRTD